jgi:uncharacterized protein YbaA (DUF1428 family)
VDADAIDLGAARAEGNRGVLDVDPIPEAHDVPAGAPFDLKRMAHGGFKTIVQG